ncbi:MAG: hypothetical protein WC523_05985 [Patescibacteria group bacterium]
MKKEINSKTTKLCFNCHQPITDNDRININSITHQGVKFNIKKRLEKFSLLPLANMEDYSLNLMHLSCYEKIEKELGKI